MSAYEKVCEVIDSVKLADHAADTDVYASRIMRAVQVEDARLEDVNKMLSVIDVDDFDDTERELAFATLALNINDHATLNWLAALCVKRVGELTGYEPGEEVEGRSDPLAATLSPDDASDLLLALSEVIDRHGKFPQDEDDQQQVERWQALSERIDLAGDWEVSE